MGFFRSSRFAKHDSIIISRPWMIWDPGSSNPCRDPPETRKKNQFCLSDSTGGFYIQPFPLQQEIDRMIRHWNNLDMFPYVSTVPGLAQLKSRSLRTMVPSIVETPTFSGWKIHPTKKWHVQYIGWSIVVLFGCFKTTIRHRLPGFPNWICTDSQWTRRSVRRLWNA